MPYHGYGGARYKNRKKPRYTSLENILVNDPIGSGEEGVVHGITVNLKSRKGNIRKREMAAKIFDPLLGGKIPVHAEDILRQFRFISNIQELNRAQKLGLHVIPTIRIIFNAQGLPAIIRTRIPGTTRPESSLTNKERKDFEKDISRQTKILAKYRIEVGSDSFVPYSDPKSGNTIAILTESATISRPLKRRLPPRKKTKPKKFQKIFILKDAIGNRYRLKIPLAIIDRKKAQHEYDIVAEDYRMARELSDLNRANNLGLFVIRRYHLLRMKNNRHQFFQAFLSRGEVFRLSESLQKQFFTKERVQIKRLEELGYEEKVSGATFSAFVEPKTQKVLVILNNPSNLYKEK